ncbi:hypothetical protein B0T20DRAFT_393540 [Sordaria brevicollis]|uniref:Uncharacterized protein n=1 Tax=Sordaria brevicollis TaxID=83679 RepID=A0AAE0UB72_SORBR|nr:hypothetical protein B0T20DRAFT_393540 [Sordaria brevicollis]
MNLFPGRNNILVMDNVSNNILNVNFINFLKKVAFDIEYREIGIIIRRKGKGFNYLIFEYNRIGANNTRIKGYTIEVHLMRLSGVGGGGNNGTGGYILLIALLLSSVIEGGIINGGVKCVIDREMEGTRILIYDKGKLLIIYINGKRGGGASAITVIITTFVGGVLIDYFPYLLIYPFIFNTATGTVITKR